MLGHRGSLVVALALLYAVPFSYGADPQTDADEKLLRRHHIGVTERDLLALLERYTLDAHQRLGLAALVIQLGDPHYAVRERAARQVKAFGPAALGLLQQQARDPDLERRRRVELCIQALAAEYSPPCLDAALRLIKARRTSVAQATIRAFLAHAYEDGVRAEAASTLSFLAGDIHHDSSPAVRSRQVAEQFLHAMSKGDWPTFRTITDVPFSLGGSLAIYSREEFDELFRPVLEERRQPTKKLVYTFEHTVRAETYPAKASERGFLANYPRHEVRAVYARVRFDDGKEDHGAIFVHWAPSRATVIGIGHNGPD